MHPNWSIILSLLALTGALAGCTTEDGHYADGHTHDEADMGEGDMDTEHGMTLDHMHDGQHEASSEMSVSIEVLEDPMKGYNLHVTTTGFEWDPASASSEHGEGKGHAHIYIDDVKLTRLYGDWYYLGSLEPGEHVVRVDLNGNDHKPYFYGGEAVADEVLVIVPSSG